MEGERALAALAGLLAVAEAAEAAEEAELTAEDTTLGPCEVELGAALEGAGAEDEAREEVADDEAAEVEEAPELVEAAAFRHESDEPVRTTRGAA